MEQELAMIEDILNNLKSQPLVYQKQYVSQIMDKARKNKTNSFVRHVEIKINRILPDVLDYISTDLLITEAEKIVIEFSEKTKDIPKDYSYDEWNTILSKAKEECGDDIKLPLDDYRRDITNKLRKKFKGEHNE